MTRTSAKPFRILHPPKWFLDVAVLLFLGLPALLPMGMGNPAWTDVGSAVTVGGALGAVLLRRRYPRLAASTVFAFSFVGVAVGGPVVPYILATLVSVFAVGNLTSRRWTLVLALVGATVLSAANLLFLDTPFQDLRATLQVFAFVGFAAAAGDASRSRREFISAITERARRAEETKESEARRRVAEERIRIARDLHDVLAHQIAVINLHAGVASQALPARPEDAERSLATIRRAARGVLGEIGSLLNVLRSSDIEEDAAGSLGPAPGLAQLDTLVDSFRASGLQLEVRVVGTPVVAEGASDVVGFRILQEALTNAHKHGADQSALLHLEYLPGEVAITVTNTVGPDTSSHSLRRPASIPLASTTGDESSGFGLTGVRERVASVGGRMETASGPGPVFRFTAWLPFGNHAHDPGKG
ncbi:signal transduction histidine kinase [Glaciihabitans tibetensis]|uniref:histidine kinase n=1 Tax=Glaciihabitans tibetensis TaxID=1266600 RepID=A0A2T0VD15_9MICO|nr:histidine kinase [Glaciihabitans tibetensis]PRY68071.1 signal transduction histidine kinase [Glaciihabitans tibetensis]